MADELDRDELQMPGLKHIHCDVSEFELFIADLLGVAPVDRNGNVRSFGSYSNDNEPGILWMVYNIPDHISIYSDHPCHRINIYHRYGGKDSLVLIVPCDFPNTHPKPSITIYDSDGGAWPVDSIPHSVLYHVSVSRWIPNSPPFDFSTVET